MLRSQAARVPRGVAVGLVQDRDGTLEEIRWGDLLAGARRRAAGYRRLGVGRGARVILELPTGRAYLEALLGAFWAGVVPATVAPFGRRGGREAAEEWRGMVAGLRPTAAISDMPRPSCAGIPVHPSAELVGEAGGAGPPAPAAGPCYVQFSSGSTGQPKGVVLDWPAVEANLDAIAGRVPLGPGEHVFSWLPMYHDMGLFGTLLAPLRAGCRLTLMDPGLFIAHPMLWFRMLSRLRASITTTPPSALHFCLQLVSRRAPPGLELGALRRVICGSEPVPPRLVRDFDAILGPLGVGAEVLKPVYGLAENTLAVTMPGALEAPRIESLDRDALETGGPVLGGEGAESVALGAPLPGNELRIVDPHGEVLEEGRIGRILLRSPSLFSGWLRDGRLVPRPPGWFDTGDLGFLAAGRLHVTGRARDLIIRNGRNYAPERIEELAQLAPGVQRAAAFGVWDAGRLSERVVVAVEVRRRDVTDPSARDRLRLGLRARLGDAGYAVDEVVVLDRGALPRTTSGKIRRRHCSRCYRSGLWGDHGA